MEQEIWAVIAVDKKLVELGADRTSIKLYFKDVDTLQAFVSEAQQTLKEMRQRVRGDAEDSKPSSPLVRL